MNKQLASGSRDYHVKTWDAETGACINEYTAPRNIVTCLDHDPSGNLLYQVCSEVPIGIAHADGRVLQGSEDLCVRVWDTRSSSSMPAMYIGGYVYFPLSISLSQHDGGIHVATGCKGFNSVGCNVKVFDIRSLKHSIIADMTGHAHDVSGVQFMNSGQLLSASKDGTIRIWSPQTGTECAKYAHDMDLQYTSIGYHRNQSGSTTKFFASSFSGVLSEFTITSETSNNGPDSDHPVIRVDYMTGPGAQTTVDS